MLFFCKDQAILADGVTRSYALSAGRAGIDRYGPAHFSVILGLGAGVEEVVFAIQLRYKPGGDWYDAYLYDYTQHLHSISGVQVPTIAIGAYADLHVDHAEDTDWARAFSPEFVVDEGARAIVQDENTGNFTVRIHNDGEWEYGAYGYGYEYGYGTPQQIRVQWVRWGRKAQESNLQGHVEEIILAADISAIVARLDDFAPYVRLRVTNNGANDAELTAGLAS